MKNEIEWKCIYRNIQINNINIGSGNETWQAYLLTGFLIRHVHYEIKEGDESNRIETMVFVPKQSEAQQCT